MGPSAVVGMGRRLRGVEMLGMPSGIQLLGNAWHAPLGAGCESLQKVLAVGCAVQEFPRGREDLRENLLQPQFQVGGDAAEEQGEQRRWQGQGQGQGREQGEERCPSWRPTGARAGRAQACSS